MGFIFDIHMFLWFSVDPVDVRNDPQQGTYPSSSYLLFKFSDVNLGRDLYHYLRKPDLYCLENPPIFFSLVNT